MRGAAVQAVSTGANAGRGGRSAGGEGGRQGVGEERSESEKECEGGEELGGGNGGGVGTGRRLCRLMVGGLASSVGVGVSVLALAALGLGGLVGRLVAFSGVLGVMVVVGVFEVTVVAVVEVGLVTTPFFGSLVVAVAFRVPAPDGVAVPHLESDQQADKVDGAANEGVDAERRGGVGGAFGEHKHALGFGRVLVLADPAPFGDDGAFEVAVVELGVVAYVGRAVGAAGADLWVSGRVATGVGEAVVEGCVFGGVGLAEPSVVMDEVVAGVQGVVVDERA